MELVQRKGICSVGDGGMHGLLSTETMPKSVVSGQEGLKEHLFEVGIYFKYKRLRTKIDLIYFLLATFLVIHM